VGLCQCQKTPFEHEFLTFVTAKHFIIQSYIKIGPVVLPLRMVKNRPFPLLWPLAYTTACTTVQTIKIKTKVQERLTNIIGTVA